MSGNTAKSPRLHPISNWQSKSWNAGLSARSMWGHIGLSPQAFTRRTPPSPPLYPFHPLIGVPEPWRGGEKGHGVKVFSSLDLGACWERLGERMAALEKGLGVKILILLKNSWFEFLLTVLFPSLFPQIQGDEKFVQRGTSKIKKVYSPKPLPLPCSSIREECNNVSIWPQLDWLKTRKSFLCFGVLTAGWNLIKKLKKIGWDFSYLRPEEFSSSSFQFPIIISHLTLNRWDKPFWQSHN